MSQEFTVILDGINYAVVVDGNTVLVNGQPFVVGFEGDRVLVDNVAHEVQIEGERAIVGGIAHALRVEGLDEPQAGRKSAAAAAASEGAVTAIMPGKIIRLLVAVGDAVNEGDVVCILEAMKMENELRAPMTGTVKALYVEPGRDVEMGSVLAEIE